MKKRIIRIGVAAAIAALFASAFAACNLYEKEEIEIRRCPQVQDTVIMPGWDEQNETNKF